MSGFARVALPVFVNVILLVCVIAYVGSTLPVLPEKIPERVDSSGNVLSYNGKGTAVGIFLGMGILGPAFILLLAFKGVSKEQPGLRLFFREWFLAHPEEYRQYIEYLRGYLAWQGLAISQLMCSILVITLEMAKQTDYVTNKTKRGNETIFVVLVFAMQNTLALGLAYWRARSFAYGDQGFAPLQDPGFSPSKSDVY